MKLKGFKKIKLNRKLVSLLVGSGLVVSLGGLSWIYGPMVWVEAKYQEQASQSEVVAEQAKPVRGFGSLMGSIGGFKDLLSVEEAEQSVEGVETAGFSLEPVSGAFGLVIPKIFVNVSVTENVNPSKEEVYDQFLREEGGVAHAAGTALPGELGTVYIFGHSTDASFNVSRYNAVFYLLRRLEPGDEIIAYYFFKPYYYQVVEKKVVEADDLGDIVNVENEQRLVLQTCWPPGTDWRRLLIVAKPKQV